MQDRSESSPIASVVLLAVALLVIAPLLVRGVSCGHDIDFHLLNWLEVSDQFRHGTLHPAWAATPAWNAGEPRFVFYPPVSWVLGALLTLLASALASMAHASQASAFATVPVTYTFLTVFTGGFALFRVARPWTSRSAALLSAVFYMCSPYALFTAYERTAYGEMLSMPLLPVLLWGVLQGVEHPPNGAEPSSRLPLPAGPSVALLAAVFGLLWLSNAPAAVMGSYAFLVLALLRLGWMLRRGRPAAQAIRLVSQWIVSALLGFALPAFFLLPALAERPWVQLGMAMIPGMRPADNTLFHHTGDPDHDAVLHTASLVASILFLIIVAASTAYWMRRRRAKALDSGTAPPATLLFVSGCLIGFMLTSPALPLWRHIPELVVLQFPWRLLAVLAVVASLLLALALRGVRARPLPLAALTLLAAAALTLPAYRSFHQVCDEEDTPQARFARFTASSRGERGAEPTDEYTPAAADNDALAVDSAPFWLLEAATPDDAPSPHQAASGPAPHTLHLHLDRPARLVLNLRDYPTWSVLRNGAPLTARINRSDGLLTVPLPAGDSDLRITPHSTAAQRIGSCISGAALVLLIVLWRSERAERGRLGGRRLSFIIKP